MHCSKHLRKIIYFSVQIMKTCFKQNLLQNKKTRRMTIQTYE